MAKTPQIQISLNMQQISQMAAQAAKILHQKLSAAVVNVGAGGGSGGGAGAGLGGGGVGGVPKPGATPTPSMPNQPGGNKGNSKIGSIERFLFGDQGERVATRNIKSSLAGIGDTLANTLGANKVGLGGVGQGFSSFGALGGAGVAAGAIGAASLAGTVMYGRSRERTMMQMAPGMGARSASKALGMGRKALFDDEETAAMAGGLSRSGALGGLSTVLRGQRGYGVGNELSSLLGGQAQRGSNVTGQSARRELSSAIGTAVATGLTRGRIGELIAGAAQMGGQRGLGGGINSQSLYTTAGRLGSGFQGAQGIQAAGALENAMRNPSTALGRNIALRTAGLGGKLGGDIFGAERQMELGFFGEQKVGGRVKKGLGQDGLDSMLGKYRTAYGFGERQKVGDQMTGEAETRRGAMLKEMSQNMGISQNATEAVVAAIETNKSQKDIKSLMEKGAPLQDQAYKAMIGMGSFKSLEKAFQSAFETMWNKLGPLIKDLIELVKQLLAYFAPKLANVMKDTGDGIKTLATKKGRSRLAAEIKMAAKDTWQEITDPDPAGSPESKVQALARSKDVQARLGNLKDTHGGKGLVSEKQTSDFVKRLMFADANPDAKARREETDKVLHGGGMDQDQMRQMAAILQGVLKGPVVHIYTQESLGAAATKIHQDSAGGTALTPASAASK